MCSRDENVPALVDSDIWKASRGWETLVVRTGQDVDVGPLRRSSEKRADDASDADATRMKTKDCAERPPLTHSTGLC